jgi:prepilin-type N-terminal cleavage/methylation domain-containing protein
MTKNICFKQSAAYLRGFTLVELTVVLFIVALLLGGMMSTMSSQVEQQRIKETQRILEEAKDALIGYAATYGRLPCPANPTVVSGTAGSGVEYPATPAGCSTSVEGVLPWATLGLPETDAWGQRLSFRVSAGFAQSIPTFTLASTGDITIRVTTGGTSVASKVPATIISHGKNGLRAYLPSGAQMGVSSDADEQENSNSDANFVSKIPSPTFDDIVIWLSPNILFNRMIAAGRLP